jgi:hypothetical protein
MLDIKIDQQDNIIIFNLTGTMSFADIVVITKTYMPLATCHVLFNLTNATMDESVTYQKLCSIPNLAKGFKTHRDPNGKSAHVCPNLATYGMLNMVSNALKNSDITHKQGVFKSMNEALEWLSE